MLNRVDELIKIGEYPSRSEAIRDGVRRLIEQKTLTLRGRIFPKAIDAIKDGVCPVCRNEITGFRSPD